MSVEETLLVESHSFSIGQEIRTEPLSPKPTSWTLWVQLRKFCVIRPLCISSGFRKMNMASFLPWRTLLLEITGTW